MRSCVFAVAVSTLVLAAAAEEKFDWEQKGTIRQDAAASAADAKLPRVLILGDSISLGYTPIVVKKMKDRAFVTRPKTNCGPSSFYLSGGNLEKWLGDGKWDVIHVNFGIWDNHYIKGGPCDMDLYWGSGYKDVTGDLAQDWAIRGEGFHLRATVKDYERNLRTILARLKRTGAKVIFGLTTPLQGWQSHETNGHLDADNEIAEAVCEEMGVKVNDLHAVACWHLADQTDGCHFNQAGYAVLADRVVEAIDDALAKGTTVVNVRDAGAKGDNRADDAPAIQKALDTAARPLEVVVPRGVYRIGSTLRIGSDTTLRLARGTRFVLSGAKPMGRRDFLLTNADWEKGNANVRVIGGSWDGNNQAPNHRRTWKRGEKVDFASGRYCTGALVNFINVKGLVLRDLCLQNAVAYFVRMCKVDGFDFRRIRFFSANRLPNQDGLHLNGFCRNGLIEDVEAWRGQSNDDLLAFNADDVAFCDLEQDMAFGPIENVTVRNVRAENCYGAVRLLSVDSPIRNVRFENLRMGVRYFAVNADAARYCSAPIFRDKDRPDGVGHLENVTFANCRFWATEPDEQDEWRASLPLFCWETNMKDVVLENVKRDGERDQWPARPWERIRKCQGRPVVRGSGAVRRTDLPSPRHGCLSECIEEKMTHTASPVFMDGRLYTLYQAGETHTVEAVWDPTEHMRMTVVDWTNPPSAPRVYDPGFTGQDFGSFVQVTNRPPCAQTMIGKGKDLYLFFRGKPAGEKPRSLWCYRRFDTVRQRLADGAVVCTLDGREFNGATATEAYNRLAGTNHASGGIGDECNIRLFSDGWYYTTPCVGKDTIGLIVRSQNLTDWESVAATPCLNKGPTMEHDTAELEPGKWVSAWRQEKLGCTYWAIYDVKTKTWTTPRKVPNSIAVKPYLFRYRGVNYLAANISGTVTTDGYKAVRATLGIFSIGSDGTLTQVKTIANPTGCHYVQTFEDDRGRLYLVYSTDERRLDATQCRSNIAFDLLEL